MARPTATNPPTTIHSLVWALSPSSPLDEGATVVAVEPGTSCCGAVVVGATVVGVLDVAGSVVVVAFGLVVVVDFGLLVVVVDFGFVVVVVGFFVVLVVAGSVVGVVVGSVVGGSTWSTPGGSLAAGCAEPGSVKATASAITTAAAAAAIERRRTVRCATRSKPLLTVLASRPSRIVFLWPGLGTLPLMPRTGIRRTASDSTPRQGGPVPRADPVPRAHLL